MRGRNQQTRKSQKMRLGMLAQDKMWRMRNPLKSKQMQVRDVMF